MTPFARTDTLETEQGTRLGWFCIGCGQWLATYGFESGGQFYAFLHEKLIRLPKDREGLPTYGLAPRELAGRTTRNWQWDNQIRLPVVAYCPRRGVCGRAQLVGF